MARTTTRSRSRRAIAAGERVLVRSPCDGKTQFLIKNPIDRYLINSPMLANMKKERRRFADHLHPEQVARTRQGSELAAAPAGPIYMAMPSTGRRRKILDPKPPGRARGSRRASAKTA